MNEPLDALDVIGHAVSEPVTGPVRDAIEALRETVEHTEGYEAALRRILELAQVPPDFPLHQPPLAAFEIIADVARSALGLVS
jgi:hypothetical protein